jgi:multiple sugar transport system substrate-binding protein
MADLYKKPLPTNSNNPVNTNANSATSQTPPPPSWATQDFSTPVSNPTQNQSLQDPSLNYQSNDAQFDTDVNQDFANKTIFQPDAPQPDLNTLSSESTQMPVSSVSDYSPQIQQDQPITNPISNDYTSSQFSDPQISQEQPVSSDYAPDQLLQESDIPTVSVGNFQQNNPSLETSAPQMPPPPTFTDDSTLQTPPPPPSGDSGVAANLKPQSSFKKLMPIALALGVIFFIFIGIQVIRPLLSNKDSQNGTGSTQSSANSKEEAPKAKTTLTYWGLWNPDNVMGEIFREYEQKNQNIKINYIQQSKSDYRERLQSELVAGTGPDIFRYHNTWLPMLKNDLQPDTEKQIKLTDYFPVVRENLTLGGETFGVPLGFDTLALYYNPRMFQQGGVIIPKTWDELIVTAKKLTVRDDKDKIQTAGIALGTTNNVDHFSDIMGLMLLQNGANPADTRDKMAEDSFKFYTNFKNRDKVWDETLPPSTYAFATEKVAMVFAPSWRVFEIKEINRDLEFEVAPVPQLPGNNIAWASYWAEGVSRKSKNAKEAWKLLTYLSSDEVLIKIYTAQSKGRLFGEPYPKPNLAKTLESDPIIGAFVKQGSYAKSWYLSSRTFDNGINDGIIKFYEDAINSVSANTPTNQVMLTLYQGVSKKLNQYGIRTGGDAVR